MSKSTVLVTFSRRSKVLYESSESPLRKVCLNCKHKNVHSANVCLYNGVLFIGVYLFRTGFWVSKKSLQKWKVLAQNVQEQLSPSGGSSPSDESTSNTRTADESAKVTTNNSDTPDDTKLTRGDESPELVDMDTDGKRRISGSEGGSIGIDDKEKLKFNEDLLCEHGKYNISCGLKRSIFGQGLWRQH